MGPFKYFVIMFLTFFRPNTQLFDDLQYCKSSKIAIFWLWWRNTWMLPLFLFLLMKSDEIYHLLVHLLYQINVHPKFCFWFLGHFWRRCYENTKIFVYILQGKMGKTEKNRKKITTKVTKNKKTKTWDERNIRTLQPPTVRIRYIDFRFYESGNQG